MIDINKLPDEQREQYIRLMGPLMATNNKAKNCYGLLANELAFALSDAHKEIIQRLSSVAEVLKNCCVQNDDFIEKLSDEFEKKYKELRKKEKAEKKKEESPDHTECEDEQKAEELDNKECPTCTL